MSDPISDLIAEVRSRQALCTPENIRRIREDAGVSVARFARALGVERSTVSRWETGATVPRPEVSERLSRLLRGLAELGEDDESGRPSLLPDTAVVDAFPLDVRVSNGLRQCGLTTLRDVSEVSANDLRSIRNFGANSLAKVREALADAGLDLPETTTRPGFTPDWWRRHHVSTPHSDTA